MFTRNHILYCQNKISLDGSYHNFWSKIAIFWPEIDILDHFGHFFINGLVKYTLMEEMLFTGVAVLYYSNKNIIGGLS